jgi:hypothetical protein
MRYSESLTPFGWGSFFPTTCEESMPIIRYYRVFGCSEQSAVWEALTALEALVDPDCLSTGLVTGVPIDRQDCERAVRVIKLAERARFVTVHQFIVRRVTRLVSIVADVGDVSLLPLIEDCLAHHSFQSGRPSEVPEELGDVSLLRLYELVASGNEEFFGGSIRPPSGIQPHGYTSRGTNYPTGLRQSN